MLSLTLSRRRIAIELTGTAVRCKRTLRIYVRYFVMCRSSNMVSTSPSVGAGAVVFASPRMRSMTPARSQPVPISLAKHWTGSKRLCRILYNHELSQMLRVGADWMLEISKRYVLDTNQIPIAVQIPIAEFEKIEKIFEDYGLEKLMEEMENDETLSKDIDSQRPKSHR